MACGALTLAGNSCANKKDDKGGEVIQMDKAMFQKEVFDYTAETKEWKFKGDKPAIIDLYADWCGPCRMVAPIMKELAVEYKDSVVFYKVNVDQERELAALFGATSIPLFVFIPVEGEPVLMKGAADKDTYVRAINEILMTSGK
jgi:thioredoxin